MNSNTEPSVAESILAFESSSIAALGTRIKSKFDVSHQCKLNINAYFTKTDKKAVLFIGEYMEIYLNANDIDHKLANINGMKVHLYGLFEMRIWNKGSDISESDEAAIKVRYLYPSTFNTIPSSIVKRSMFLSEEDGDRQYIVLKYFKNSIFIESTEVIKNPSIASNFTNHIYKAFIPKIIHYEEIALLLDESSKINGVNFNVSATLLEIMIATQARYAKDITIPYRMYLGKQNLDEPLNPKDMTLIKVTELPYITNTFNSFSFRNIDYAVAMSAKRHRGKKNTKHSDLEELLKY